MIIFGTWANDLFFSHKLWQFNSVRGSAAQKEESDYCKNKDGRNTFKLLWHSYILYLLYLLELICLYFIHVLQYDTVCGFSDICHNKNVCSVWQIIYIYFRFHRVIMALIFKHTVKEMKVPLRTRHCIATKHYCFGSEGLWYSIELMTFKANLDTLAHIKLEAALGLDTWQSCILWLNRFVRQMALKHPDFYQCIECPYKLAHSIVPLTTPISQSRMHFETPTLWL